MSTGGDTNWHEDIFATLRALDITLVAQVPDAGHARLLDACAEAGEMRVVTLTTEQDGVAALAAIVRAGPGPYFANVKVSPERAPPVFPYSFDGGTAIDRFRAAATG